MVVIAGDVSNCHIFAESTLAPTSVDVDPVASATFNTQSFHGYVLAPSQGKSHAPFRLGIRWSHVVRLVHSQRCTVSAEYDIVDAAGCHERVTSAQELPLLRKDDNTRFNK
jgi:hypothetical protein